MQGIPKGRAHLEIRSLPGGRIVLRERPRIIYDEFWRSRFHCDLPTSHCVRCQEDA